jgi:hypothetical protein
MGPDLPRRRSLLISLICLETIQSISIKAESTRIWFTKDVSLASRLLTPKTQFLKACLQGLNDQTIVQLSRREGCRYLQYIQNSVQNHVVAVLIRESKTDRI